MPPRKKKVEEAPRKSWLMGVVADVHAHNHARNGGPMVDGLNRRGRETVATLRRAVVAAHEAGCRAFLVAGDLFHVRRPDPALIAAVQGALEVPEMAVIVVPGNHDCLDASAEGGNTACAPLINVTVVLKPTWFTLGQVGPPHGPAAVWDLAVLAVPFDGRRPMAEVLESVVPAMREERPRARSYVLVTHVGVFTEEGAAPWQLRAKDGMGARRFLDLLEENEFSQGFVGNYHDHRVWNSLPGGPVARAVQVGTLCPASHSDGGLEGRGLMALADGVDFEMQEIPGPRFLTVREGESVLSPQPGWSHYVRQIGGLKEPDPELVARGASGFDWVPDVGQRDTKPGNVSIAATPEEALRAACAAVEPVEIQAPVEELVMQAWAEGA